MNELKYSFSSTVYSGSTLKSESAENEFSEYMQNDTQSDKNASIIAANAANAKPMQNRAIG